MKLDDSEPNRSEIQPIQPVVTFIKDPERPKDEHGDLLVANMDVGHPMPQVKPPPGI